MHVTYNGERIEVKDTLTLSSLLRRFQIDLSGRGVAVAINNRVVPQQEWEKQQLQPEDHIEVIQAIQGG